MTGIKQRHKVVIDKFQELLRSGKDYSVMHMYKEAGSTGYLKIEAARQIVNKHYRQIVSSEMIEFINNTLCSQKEEAKQFSDKFEVCKRESILLIRYIKRRNE